MLQINWDQFLPFQLALTYLLGTLVSQGGSLCCEARPTMHN